MDVDRHTVAVRGVDMAMPLKEYELLEVLLRNSGRVLTRGQLANRKRARHQGAEAFALGGRGRPRYRGLRPL